CLEACDCRNRSRVARDDGVVSSRRDEILFEQLGGSLELTLRIFELGSTLLQVRFSDFDIRGALLHLRSDVTILEPRDDFARLDLAAFAHAEPFETAGRLRRDCGLALRDDVTRRIEHGVNL